MPSKKKDETTENNSVEEQNAEATGDASAVAEEKADAVEAQGAETSEATEATAETQATEEKPKKSKKAKSENAESNEGGSIVDSVIGAVAGAVESVAGTVANLVTGSSDKKADTGRGNRAERVGTVTSDKMTKTVVVRVDRLVKHPKYRKYVRQKKQFMAHDELGATIGDKVRIVETRPLSARKRWRVVEIVQKAAK